jgi:farnesyl-diphosphate farnesyltransferase
LGELASDPSRLFHAANQDTREAVLRSLVEKAERHLLAGEQYIRQLPRRERRVRVFCLLPYLFAVRTLALSRDNPAIFADEVKMPRSEVKTITRRSLALGTSNGFISWYARRLATK